MDGFSSKAKEELEFYVYALVDSRNNKIFYIGKGKNDRAFQHCKACISECDESLKLKLIREIIDSGATVEHYIIRHKLTEKEAFQIESTIIDLLTYPKFNTENILTNIMGGHHKWDEGIKTMDEISAIYDCDKIIVNPKDRLLLVSLNKSYDSEKASGVYCRENIYEKTRKYWSIAKTRAQKIDYVLGVYHGIVRAVLKVVDYEWTLRSDDGRTIFKKERCCFNGYLVKDSAYLNKDVSDYPFGSGGAFRYINVP